MNLHEKHMARIDAVNNAKSRIEHIMEYGKLEAWRDGAKDAGRTLDLCAADLEQIDRGHGERPMCCGVFLDWKECE